MHLVRGEADDCVGHAREDPQGELVHPVRRRYRVVSDARDRVLCVLCGGRRRERRALLHWDLRAGEDHRRRDE